MIHVRSEFNKAVNMLTFLILCTLRCVSCYLVLVLVFLRGGIQDFSGYNIIGVAQHMNSFH